MASTLKGSATLYRATFQLVSLVPCKICSRATRPLSTTCTILRSIRTPPLPRHRVHSSSSSSANPQQRPRIYLYTALSLSILPGLYFLLPPSLRPSRQENLSPQRYTTHRISAVQSLSPTHVFIEIPIPEESRSMLKTLEGKALTQSVVETRDQPLPVSHTADEGEYVTIHHVCVKSPDLQIERPYTPINDVEKDGMMKIVVKRVKGGEVGR